MVDNQELEYRNSLFIYLPWASFIVWNSDKSYEENQSFQMQIKEIKSKDKIYFLQCKMKTTALLL